MQQQNSIPAPAGASDQPITREQQHALIEKSFDDILRLTPKQQQEWIAGLRALSPRFGSMADIYQEHVDAEAGRAA